MGEHIHTVVHIEHRHLKIFKYNQGSGSLVRQSFLRLQDHLQRHQGFYGTESRHPSAIASYRGIYATLVLMSNRATATVPLVWHRS